MEKILFTASIDGHLIGFHIPYIKWFNDQGYEVHTASNGNGKIPYVHMKHNIQFERSPFKFTNILAYKQLKKIIEENDYKLIHCHTPMASFITRLAARRVRKKGAKVMYTAHGFHFFKGAPIINWLLYYPIEKLMARYTDCIITMNDEDYNISRNHLAKNNTRFVNGIGVDLTVYKPQTTEKKDQLRKHYGYKKSDFILTFAGELSYRKHQDLLINAISCVKENIAGIKLLLAGEGCFYDQYKDQIIKLGLEEYVFLLGKRNDIVDLMMLSDVAVSSSRQEGLPVNVMEGIATGLPMIVTDCRGNRDLVKNNENGYIIGIENTQDFCDAILKLYDSPIDRMRFANNNIEIIKKYSIENTIKEMAVIYNEYL
ncbi:MAG: glycosyltransferase family 1 protein [Firmicutes bacterium HGW-Firmicutes-1]|jgi:glycosyltransferase EpsD|nr:MAG: glycosyltransferase family 1 protein [Firmicutes bacterium HGW-Firmicutes-1]